MAVNSTPTPSTILHIPHASRIIPDAVRSKILLNSQQLEDELNRLTDHFTDDLFASQSPGVCTVVFPVSRFIVDPERFENDSDEPMSRIGMGMIYTHATDGRPFRSPVTPEARLQLLHAYYHPHHSVLENRVSQALTNCGKATIIDCHSFPDRPLLCDHDQTPDRPDFCIGTDSFHTPVEWIQKVIKFIQTQGYSVAINAPYAGTIVPLTHYGQDPKVGSIMIEVNRRLYLTNGVNSRTPSVHYQEVKSFLESLVRMISTLKVG